MALDSKMHAPSGSPGRGPCRRGSWRGTRGFVIDPHHEGLDHLERDARPTGGRLDAIGTAGAAVQLHGLRGEKGSAVRDGPRETRRGATEPRSASDASIREVEKELRRLGTTPMGTTTRRPNRGPHASLGHERGAATGGRRTMISSRVPDGRYGLGAGRRACGWVRARRSAGPAQNPWLRSRDLQRRRKKQDHASASSAGSRHRASQTEISGFHQPGPVYRDTQRESQFWLR